MVTYFDLLSATFRINGRGEDGTYDCYGLCMEVSRRFGKELPEIQTPSKLIGMDKLLINETESGVRWRPVGVEEAEWGVIEGSDRLGKATLYGVKKGAIAYFRVDGVLAHVGIVIAPDRFIHAWEKAGGVCVERLSAWKPRLVGLYEHKSDSR